MKKLWGFISSLSTAYFIYERLKGLSRASDELASTLSPAQKKVFDEYFKQLSGETAKPDNVVSSATPILKDDNMSSIDQAFSEA